jgi:hypothetical protein
MIHMEIKKEIDRLLDEGVIVKSHSPASSPIVMIKKPEGTYRTIQS